jgi:hypothetical protein
MFLLAIRIPPRCGLVVGLNLEAILPDRVLLTEDFLVVRGRDGTCAIPEADASAPERVAFRSPGGPERPSV